MADLAQWESLGNSELLFFHFDVQDHFLKLETFIKTAESAQRVIASLNSTFFGGSLEYEIIVVPPEEGTFLSKLGLWIIGGTVAFSEFADTDHGVAYIESITGHPPSHWATEAGEKTKDALLRAKELIESDAEQENGISSDEPQDHEACRTAAKITVEMTRAILELSPERLDRVGMEIGNLPDALDARADFYRACLEDQEVNRVGFTRDDDFPIPRNSFPERAIRPERKDPDETPAEWIVTDESIYVTSPNWDEEDQNARQWKGKDQSRRDCYFVVEDREFWQLVKRKALHVEGLDNLKVQWAYQIVDGRPKNRRVLRVLEFNGDKLADPLSPDAVSAILGEYSVAEASWGEPSLFDDD